MTNDDQLPLTLRPHDAAKALGVSPRILWQLTKGGDIPCLRVRKGKRRSIFYPVADLQAWLTKQADATKAGAR